MADAFGLTEYFSDIRQAANDLGNTYSTIKGQVDSVSAQKAITQESYQTTAANAQVTGNAPVANFLTGKTAGIPNAVLAVVVALGLIYVVAK